MQKDRSGGDGVHYHMIKQMSQSGQLFMLQLYNKIWIDGVFPASWQRAILLPFLKPGKLSSSTMV